jgi:hypothetical protein
LRSCCILLVDSVEKMIVTCFAIFRIGVLRTDVLSGHIVRLKSSDASSVMWLSMQTELPERWLNTCTTMLCLKQRS